MIRAVAVLALALGACSGRGCSRGGASTDASVDVRPGISLRDRCRIEVAHASVASPPGFGPIEVIMPACGGESLAVWALRGHTLSRAERSLTPGGTFSLPEVIATGADRLGPVAPDAFDGPVAWRSPTLGMDPGEGDEWWVGWADHSAAPGSRARLGSTLLGVGAVGLGTIAPVGRTPQGIEVLATVAREGQNPRLVRHTVPAPTNAVESLNTDPPALAEAELKAWEPRARVALAYALSEGGDAVLRALDFSSENMVDRGSVGLEREHVLVHPRGANAGGAAWFGYTAFDVQRGGGSARACLELDPSLCVVPGPVTLVRVDARGVSEVRVAESGLIDSVASDGAGGVLVLYIAGGAAGDGGEQGVQRAARVDAHTRAVRAVELAPSDDVPPLDHPTLVACGGDAWLVAEVLVSEASDGGHARETAVMALPFACVGR